MGVVKGLVVKRLVEGENVVESEVELVCRVVEVTLVVLGPGTKVVVASVGLEMDVVVAIIDVVEVLAAVEERAKAEEGAAPPDAV